MAHDSYPKGADLGHSGDRRQLGTFNITFVAEHGSRAQRRQAKRQLTRMAAAGIEEARIPLAYLQAHQDRRKKEKAK
jgi:hypothetical protein